MKDAVNWTRNPLTWFIVKDITNYVNTLQQNFVHLTYGFGFVQLFFAFIVI